FPDDCVVALPGAVAIYAAGAFQGVQKGIAEKGIVFAANSAPVGITQRFDGGDEFESPVIRQGTTTTTLPGGRTPSYSVGSARLRGKVQVKVLPLPGSLWMWSVAPWRSSVCLTMARPRPVPPVLAARPLSTR